ncbi:hypothetical protein [Geomicrobium sp. JCM 19055]|uniref:hypothetical protein n=1 Tax=Geomicrobium sp. JCM 19055 TaxID=1460649 RepID=UPI00045ED314|nr:hypothetical protein [Geomicrobium sp. JCM 19055]GAK01488.1 hypothetical protein JCM19055_4654 [Geomicrobium sp. JCM 19055]
MKVYVTPEEYESAAEIGVSKRNVYDRINRQYWDKERAISTPLIDRSRGSKKSIS